MGANLNCCGNTGYNNVCTGCVDGSNTAINGPDKWQAVISGVTYRTGCLDWFGWEPTGWFWQYVSGDINGTICLTKNNLYGACGWTGTFPSPIVVKAYGSWPPVGCSDSVYYTTMTISQLYLGVGTLPRDDGSEGYRLILMALTNDLTPSNYYYPTAFYYSTIIKPIPNCIAGTYSNIITSSTPQLPSIRPYNSYYANIIGQDGQISITPNGC